MADASEARRCSRPIPRLRARAVAKSGRRRRAPKCSFSVSKSMRRFIMWSPARGGTWSIAPRACRVFGRDDGRVKSPPKQTPARTSGGKDVVEVDAVGHRFNNKREGH